MACTILSPPYQVVGEFFSPLPPSSVGPTPGDFTPPRNDLGPQKSVVPETDAAGVARDLAIDRLRAMLCHSSIIMGDMGEEDVGGQAGSSMPGTASPLPSEPDCPSSPDTSEKDWRRARSLWRWIICEWSYKVVTYFGMDASTLWAALSYLDRYVDATGPCDNKGFKLAAMASLYLAIKVYEPKSRRVTSEQIAHLSRDDFRPGDIARMEMQLLMVLQWRVNTPTPVSFVHEFINVSKTLRELPDDEIARLTELCSIGVAMSAYEVSFVGVHPSTIAFALVLVAMDHIDSSAVTSDLFTAFCDDICAATGARHDPEVTMRFNEMFNRHNGREGTASAEACRAIRSRPKVNGSGKEEGYDTPTFVADFPPSTPQKRESPEESPDADSSHATREGDRTVLLVGENCRGELLEIHQKEGGNNSPTTEENSPIECLPERRSQLSDIFRKKCNIEEKVPLSVREEVETNEGEGEKKVDEETIEEANTENEISDTVPISREEDFKKNLVSEDQLTESFSPYPFITIASTQIVDNTCSSGKREGVGNVISKGFTEASSNEDNCDSFFSDTVDMDQQREGKDDIEMCCHHEEIRN